MERAESTRTVQASRVMVSTSSVKHYSMNARSCWLALRIWMLRRLPAAHAGVGSVSAQGATLPSAEQPSAEQPSAEWLATAAAMLVVMAIVEVMMEAKARVEAPKGMTSFRLQYQAHAGQHQIAPAPFTAAMRHTAVWAATQYHAMSQ